MFSKAAHGISYKLYNYGNQTTSRANAQGRAGMRVRNANWFRIQITLQLFPSSYPLLFVPAHK